MSELCAPDDSADPAGGSTDPADDTHPADPGYLAAVSDLLGVLAYGELRAFTQLAKDTDLAPDLRHKSSLAMLAAQELKNFTLISERLDSLGVAREVAMEPFVAPLDAFHERTVASDWLEGLVKAYVGEGIAQDFYREISAYVDDDTRALVTRVLEDTGKAEFIVGVIRDEILAQPRVAGRLALWGRRLVGEAIQQAQRVGVERDALASILVGSPGRAGADLAELGRMFVRLTDEHTRRMERLGLSA
ncbi:MAG: ferritin-like domain-containing protein [Humibacillus sp.]|nr:ferritin-like domain-containing protein [Humibacillus sp.]MDN5776871.1 ferritin-like domain-containing protein [Humibacillus sp.]